MRITQKFIEKKIEVLNSVLDLPATTWERIEGKNIGQVGNIHLNTVFSGYQILQIVNTSGGCRFPFVDGTLSLKECAAVLDTVHKLIYAAKENGQKLSV